MNLHKKSKYFLILTSIYLLILSCQNNKYNCPIDQVEIAKNDSIINLKSTKIYLNNYWKRYDEPILQNGKNESYRISIRNLLSRELFIYRITKINNRYYLNFKEYQTSTSLKYGLPKSKNKDIVINQKQIELNKKEWEFIVILMNKNCFWTIASSSKDKRIILDGIIYVLEGQKPNKKNPTHRDYHLSQRHSPEKSSFKTICNEFIEFAYYKTHKKIKPPTTQNSEHQ